MFSLQWLLVMMLMQSVGGNVFSSVAAMMKVPMMEAKLLGHLEKVLDIARTSVTDGGDKRIDELDRLTKCLKKKNNAWSSKPSVVHSPVPAYLLLKRVVEDWKKVFAVVKPTEKGVKGVLEKNMITMRDAVLKWEQWPTDSDVDGAALGLIRIGHMYSLYPDGAILKSQNPVGSFEKLRGIRPFEAADCNTAGSLSKSSLSTHACHKDEHACQQESAKVSQTLHSASADYKCAIEYRHLPVRDLMYVTKTAIKHGLSTEAKMWFSLVFLSLNESQTKLTAKGVRRCQQISKALRKLLRNSEEVQGVDEIGDWIKPEYKRLCQESVKATESASLQASSRLFCSWKHSFPYVRYGMEVLHLDPDVYRFYDVISEKEMQYIRELSAASLSPSMLQEPDGQHKMYSSKRVSHTAWLLDDDPLIRSLSVRVSHVTDLATRHQEVETAAEPFQVINYGLGGMYTPHEDSVRTARSLGSEDMISSLKDAGDRLATWMFYMSDVTLGGATVFPLLNLTIHPIKGTGVLWYNLKRSGDADRRTVHAACPLVYGDKWVANKWMRERPQAFTHPCALSPDK